MYPQAQIAFTRLRRGLPAGLAKPNETALTLKLPNDTVISFKSAEKPDNLYGENVKAAVMDEATRMREEAWHAIRSTLTATQGQLRIIGNVKGRKNWAYALARKAQAGEPGWHYAKITAADAVKAGIIKADEVEDARRQLPAAVFKELYEAEPSDDSGNPFGGTAIVACLAALSSQPAVIWGWDLAKSTDWTVGIGLDVHGHVAAFHRFQKPWEDTLQDVIRLTTGIALVDATGVGDPIFERLQKADPTKFFGFTFTSKSKQQIMEGLAVAIQQKEITFPDGPIRAELDLSSTVGSEAWNSRDLKSRPH